MKQNKYYLYKIEGAKPSQDFSVIGVVDGSGSMSLCWPYLCKAWNNFIQSFKSTFCIQFDDNAMLQKSPLLNQQMGEETNIQNGFQELIKLIESGKVLQQAIIVFITDGVGEDRIEDYIDQLAITFQGFHEKDFQFKFYTLAIGEDFSHQIVAELKSRIHNSNMISSQLEYILNYEIDFTIKLEEIKKEIFYQLVRVEPPVQLVPDGEFLKKVASNQTILSQNRVITINGKQLTLGEMTIEKLDEMIRQMIASLIQDSSRKKNVQLKARDYLEFINQFIKEIPDFDQDENRFKILDNIQIIEQFADGILKFGSMNPKDAATLTMQIQNKNIKKKQQIQNESQSDRFQIESPEEQVIKAKNKLNNIQKQIKTKPVFNDFVKLYQKNNQSSPQLLAKMAIQQKGGEKLQAYVKQFQEESIKIFQLLHIIKGEI